MSKISDILSKRVALTLIIEGLPVYFDRFNISVMAHFEEMGISYTEIGKKAAEQPVSFGVQLGWELMKPESRLLFDNDISLFMRTLSPDDLSKIIDLVNTKIDDAMPTEGTIKNDQGPKEMGK